MKCFDCNVAPGTYHRPGCAFEQCPYCGAHAGSCPCCEGLPPLDDRLPWTGSCAWVDACLAFGFFAKAVNGAWVACPPDDPASEPDVERLAAECVWNRAEKCFERRGSG